MIRISDSKDAQWPEFKVTEDQLRSSSWSGFTFAEDGQLVTALIGRSQAEPDKFMVRVCGTTASENLRPVSIEMVAPTLIGHFEHHGADVDSIRWKPCKTTPIDTQRKGA